MQRTRCVKQSVSPCCHFEVVPERNQPESSTGCPACLQNLPSFAVTSIAASTANVRQKKAICLHDFQRTLVVAL